MLSLSSTETSGYDIICVTDCGPNPTASLSPLPRLLSRMTPRASGTAAKVSAFQSVEYTDHQKCIFLK